MGYLSQKANAKHIIFVLFFLLSGCGGHVFHVVKRGETLYSIGWAYGYDYRQVAKWNRIKSPYHLNPGQRLRVAPPAGQSVAALQEYRPDISRKTHKRANNGAAPVVGPSGSVGGSGSATANNRPPRNTSSSVTTSQTPPSSLKQKARKVVSKVKEYFGSKTLTWRWPTKGRSISKTFSLKDPTRQGLDISGTIGSPVVVAASGKVVYAGSGLARYGKLIIVKHNEKYLSAYAFNKKLHIKEGELVKAGQKIADMGSVSTNGRTGRAKLHFEIRRNGKPVDPLRYLPRK